MDPSHLILTLLLTATLAPLVSCLVVLFIGKRVMGTASGWFATVVMAVAFGCALWALLAWMGWPAAQRHTIVLAVPWIPLPGSETPWLYLGGMVDSLTVAMMAMVTGVSMLVHLYSIGYMEGDARFERFFAYLSLFTFSMLGIVMSHSLIMLFVFWELVGLTSYLLIGFWFEKRAPQLACRKAFVMNRIGDMGFLIGFGILFWKLGGNVFLPAVAGNGRVSMFEALRQAIEAQGYSINHPPLWLTAAGIGLFFGAVGKSAQFPLHTWLPDAMEGPTPVSSIVHSATMVAAGVYLTARIYPILTPGAHLFVATIGLITLTIAAAMALVMTDIKRVLAYSTLSQLGYMVLGLGAGAWTFALFHLITHAFFKCCLFQCSGSVINASHHEQDMRQYGGLGKKMPITAGAYLVSTLAISGASLPFMGIGLTGGFYSKDGIIAGCYNYGSALAVAGHTLGPIFYWTPLIIAFVTVFYMARSFALTFMGQPRNKHLYEHVHEAPWTMTVPQVALALSAVLAMPMVLPFLHLINGSMPTVSWVQPGQADHMKVAYEHVEKGLLFGVAWIIVLLGGIAMYRPGMKYGHRVATLPGVNVLYTWTHNKFYFDALYDIFIVGCGKALAFIVGTFDKYIVDGLVNLAGLIGKGTGFFIGSFDKLVVDGAVNAAADLTQAGGRTLRLTQPGRVRVYVLLTFATGVVVTLIVVAAAMLR